MINKIIPNIIKFLLFTGFVINIGCTCMFEFDYRGRVIDSHSGEPLSGIKIMTLNYDLYAIDPEDNNDIWPGKVEYTNSLGQFSIESFGFYDCGFGGSEINSPGDLGIIYFYFAKDGFIPVDTGFNGNSLKPNGDYYLIPDISLVPSDN